ncbi:MAG: energy-coupling factor transporter transmembrane protein EcfT [Anaerolineae bacterium]|nr:energy-coupling factor transporter transmembrane protein EcfT [Anaerolineae bacterium]
MSEFEYLRNVTIGQYLPTGSPVHLLDPRAKLVIAALFLAGVVITTSLTGLVGTLAAVVGSLALARIPLRYAARGLRPTWPFLVFLAVLQVFTIPQNDVGPVLWQWRWLIITPTDLLSATIALARFVVLILGISLVSLSTSTTEITHGVEHLLRPLGRIGLPAHEFALTLVIALRFVPIMALEAERIAKAQASRGADLGYGRMNPLKRARHMLPLLIPLFVTALRRAETLVMAMEARCYMGGQGRTHLVHLQASWKDGMAVLIVALLVAALIAAARLNLDGRLWQGLFG